VDTEAAEPEAFEFSELAFEEVFPLSAIHGLGIEPLVKAAVEALPLPAATPAIPGERHPPARRSRAAEACHLSVGQMWENRPS